MNLEGVRTLGFEIDHREIREGQCGMLARMSNPFLSTSKNPNYQKK
ncbi:hypothetical protein LV84_02420 [Algoriphagus ratkowskyi]|uniref:Uncharacterized protein n=1 Tax=Algoriphagus ratkowskyi TaxID=57028 RepID=A0A2W7R5A0_9BACT|nr:hypothetical protein LV84_02420 [Algoriphagus ratkowskyi]